jgi:hypothetical protein
MPPHPRPPQKPLPPGQRFKPEIETARAGGVAESDLLLRLTFGDASKLKRDPNVSTADLSFLGGETRYLGVKVVEGGVATSALVILTA